MSARETILVAVTVVIVAALEPESAAALHDERPFRDIRRG